MSKNAPLSLSHDARALAADPAARRQARRTAALYTRRWPFLREEFQSAAYLAIVEAARTFEPMRGVRFKTHLDHRLSGAMLDVMRASRPAGYRRQDLSSAPSRTIPITKSLDRSEAGPNTEELAPGWAEESLDEIDRLLRPLPPLHRQVVRMLYCHADIKNQADVGRALGLSESWISIVRIEAVSMLRKFWAVDREGVNRAS